MKTYGALLIGTDSPRCCRYGKSHLSISKTNIISIDKESADAYAAAHVTMLTHTSYFTAANRVSLGSAPQ